MKHPIENTQILRSISNNPFISQREIASRNGMSLGKVNYAIKSLIEKGYIKIQNFNASQNKRKYAYVLTPAGIHEKAKRTSDFLKWKMNEYERIKKEIEELEADINSQRQKSTNVQDGEVGRLLTREI